MYRHDDASNSSKIQDFGEVAVWFLAASTKTMNDPLYGACCILDLDGDLQRSCNGLMGKLESWVCFCVWVTESKWELSLNPSLQPAIQ